MRPAGTTARSGRLLHHVAELTGERAARRRSPSNAVASTNSTSPPAPVTARPVATPGTPVRSAASGWKPAGRGSAGRRRRRRSPPAPMATSPVATWRRDLADERAQGAFQGADAGLPGVAGDDLTRARLGDGQLVGGEARCARAGGAAGGRGRWRPSRPRCSRRGGRRSMRSSSGPGMVSITLAVAMNSTSDRSRSTSR